MKHLNNLNIVIAERKDVDELHKLETESFTVDSFSKRRITYLIDKANSEVLIIRRNNKIIASLIMLKRKNSKQYRIYSIAIAPEARGFGLAKRLLQYIDDLSKSKGIKKISLEVNINNYVAINLYKSNGYQIDREKDNYYSDGSSALIMTKEI